MSDPAQIEDYLNARLLGQREAVADFCSAIIRAEWGPQRPNRTKAFLLLLGPTGTGKTEMVNLSARYLYGSNAAARIERFDMGEYQHPDSVKRLLGGPDQPPLLGRAIDRLNAHGGGILLLDEIEKAFPDLLTVLLSFDSARSTMFDGATRDLAKLIVVLTSNLGAAEAARMENSGYSAISRKLLHAAEERFRKEGVARFTAVICMNVLSFSVQEQITRQLLAHELTLQGCHLHRLIEAGSDVVNFLIGKGFSPDLGARNIRNCIERHVGDAIRPHLRRTKREAASIGASAERTITDRYSSALVLGVERDALVAQPLERGDRMAELLSAPTSTMHSALVMPRAGRPVVAGPSAQPLHTSFPANAVS